MLRIIGGTLRGRALRAPRGRSTRPTSARVREAIFDVIAHHPTHGLDLDGARVADLFAGTGALGIEALSRGAREALFVEQDRQTASLLRRNLDELGLAGRGEVWTLDATRAREALGARAPFDLLLLDPPYGQAGGAPRLLASLGPEALLARPGLMVLEQAARAEIACVPGFDPPLERRWGDTAALFYVRVDAQPARRQEKGDDLE